MTSPAPYPLPGRRALVTGGTRGIGAATARVLADAGARVVISARSEPETGDGRLTFVAADLTTAAGAADLATRTLEILGGLDILVSNAGGQTFRPAGVFAFDDADWEADLAINLMAAVRLDRLLVPAMIEARAGAVVHVSSGAARLPRPASLPYTASKAALSAYSKGLAVEVGRQGVRVNCVLPGSSAGKTMPNASMIGPRPPDCPPNSSSSRSSTRSRSDMRGRQRRSHS
jgi:NAD(P)-dependent dehydrogenase (short-subunit alcohol dehydrogenase family)